MLDVNNVIIPTPYQSYRKDEEFDFDELSQRDRRSKRIGRREKYFKTRVRRDGALHGVASAYFLPSSQYS